LDSLLKASYLRIFYYDYREYRFQDKKFQNDNRELL